MPNRYGMLVDLKRCIGCYSCIMACKQDHGVVAGKRWNRVTTVGPIGKFPDVRMHYVYTMCMHCEKPPCVDACPTGALYKRDDGIVLVDESKCRACFDLCEDACPYRALARDTARGKQTKCTLCVERLEVGEQPLCVQTCVTEALIFGKVEELPKLMAARTKGATTHRLLEDQGTAPGLHYSKDPELGTTKGRRGKVYVDVT